MKIKRIIFIIPFIAACSKSSDLDAYPSKKMEIACNENATTVNKSTKTPSIYIDSASLPILKSTSIQDYSYRTEDIIEFMLKNGFLTIDTENNNAGDRKLSDPIARPIPNDYIRIAIKKSGDPACQNFPYIKKYPALAWPWLRRLGLKKDSCIGIERVETKELASVKIKTTRTVIGSQYNNMFWQSRVEMNLTKTTDNGESILASMINHYGGGGGGNAGYRYGFLCPNGESQFKTFRESFLGSLTDLPKLPETTYTSPQFDSVFSEKTDDKTLTKIKWIHYPEQSWSSNIINPEGTIWLRWMSGPSDSQYNIESFINGRIISTKIKLPEFGLQDVTGLASNQDGYLVIAGVNLRNQNSNRYLVSFNSNGEIYKISKLTPNQYLSLLQPKQ